MDEKRISAFTESKLTCEQILSQGREQAREILNSLSHQQKTHLFLTADPKNRMRLLSALDRPKDIVQAVPEEEVYWTIKEIGVRKSLPLLKMTSDDQLHFLCDVEWWDGETLNLKRMYTWLKALTMCGDAKVSQWLRSFDFDLLALTLKKFIRVYKPHDDYVDDYGESIDNLPLVTFDGAYFIHFLKKESTDIVRRILAVLCSLDLDLYRKLMEYIIWGIDAEVEYETFQSSQERLDSKGIPEYDEARLIYRFIPKNERNKLPEKDEITRKTDNIQKSFYPLRLCGKPDLFLTKVLEQIDDYAVIEDLSMGLARVANKVLVADHLGINNMTTFKNKLAKTSGIINIGLEILSDSDEERAEYALRHLWMEHIFQVGWSVIIDFKRTMEPIIDTLKRSSERGLEIFDFPLKEILVGIDKPAPMYFTGEDEAQNQSYRDFQSVFELNTTRDSVENAAFLADLIFHKLGLCLPDTDKQAIDYYAEEAYTLKSMLMTALSNRYVHNVWRVRPLDLETMRLFLDGAFVNDAKSCEETFERDLALMVADSVAQMFTDRQALSFNGFLKQCIKQLEQEYREATEEGYLDIIAFKIIKIHHFSA